MPEESHVKFVGKVEQVHRAGQFLVTLENGVTVTAKLSGRMRQNRIRVLLGDWVDVALSPYDMTKGIIKFRHKDNPNPAPEA